MVALEEKVCKVREHFTADLLNKRKWSTEAEVDEFFKRNSTTEISKQLSKISAEKTGINLGEQFKKAVTVNGVKQDDSKEGKRNLLTTRLNTTRSATSWQYSGVMDSMGKRSYTQYEHPEPRR